MSTRAPTDMVKSTSCCITEDLRGISQSVNQFMTTEIRFMSRNGMSVWCWLQMSLVPKMLNIPLRLSHADLLENDVFGFFLNVCMKSHSFIVRKLQQGKETQSETLDESSVNLTGCAASGLLPFSGHGGTKINYWVRALAVSLSRTAAVGMKPDKHRAGTECTWNLLKGCRMMYIPVRHSHIFFTQDCTNWVQRKCKLSSEWILLMFRIYVVHLKGPHCGIFLSWRMHVGNLHATITSLPGQWPLCNWLERGLLALHT